MRAVGREMDWRHVQWSLHNEYVGTITDWIVRHTWDIQFFFKMRPACSSYDGLLYSLAAPRHISLVPKPTHALIFMYRSAAMWFWCVSLHARCSAVSSATALDLTVHGTSCFNFNKLGSVGITYNSLIVVAMVTKAWLTSWVQLCWFLQNVGGRFKYACTLLKDPAVACSCLCIPLSVNIILCVHSLRCWAALNFSPLRFVRRDSTLTKIRFVHKYILKYWEWVSVWNILAQRGTLLFSVFVQNVCSASRTLHTSLLLENCSFGAYVFW